MYWLLLSPQGEKAQRKYIISRYFYFGHYAIAEGPLWHDFIMLCNTFYITPITFHMPDVEDDDDDRRRHIRTFGRLLRYRF